MHKESPDDWLQDSVYRLSDQESLSLEKSHLLWLGFMRSYYRDYGMVPIKRVFFAELKQKHNEIEAGSLALYRLFPKGFGQLCFLAGVPIPRDCLHEFSP